MSMRRSLCSTAGILAAAIWAFEIPAATAQSGETEVGEVYGIAGAAFGGGSSGIGTQPHLAGGTGIVLNRNTLALFETSFTPLGQHTIQGWPARETIQHSYLIDFGIDFHIRIPVKPRWAPYAIVGAGLMWDRVSAGVSSYQHYDQFNAALHTGGGLRYYLGEKWGIRPEAKVIVSKQIYTCMSVGIFYVVPTNWP